MRMCISFLTCEGSVKLIASCPDEHILNELPPGCRGVVDNKETLYSSEVVFLAVKPAVVRSVLNELRPHFDSKKHTVISIAAGITLNTLEKVGQS